MLVVEGAAIVLLSVTAWLQLNQAAELNRPLVT